MSPETLSQHEKIVEAADGLAIQRCAHIVREADFHDKLVRLREDSSLPILCVHGDCDSGAPYERSSKLIQEIIPRAQVNLYEKAAHGKDFRILSVLPSIKRLTNSLPSCQYYSRGETD